MGNTSVLWRRKKLYKIDTRSKMSQKTIIMNPVEVYPAYHLNNLLIAPLLTLPLSLNLFESFRKCCQLPVPPTSTWRVSKPGRMKTSSQRWAQPSTCLRLKFQRNGDVLFVKNFWQTLNRSGDISSFFIRRKIPVCHRQKWRKTNWKRRRIRPKVKTAAQRRGLLTSATSGVNIAGKIRRGAKCYKPCCTSSSI